jgi:bifunctional non-homologous end joining protein LigD
MHATELPKPFHRDGWVYEEKYDGWRMVAEKAGSEVTLTSRSGLDHTKRFPELGKAVAELDASSLILDGEIAMFDRQLISRFEWLRNRPKDDVSTPPMYMVFDVLELEGEDLRPKPLRERRQALEELVAERQLIIPARQLPANGLEGTRCCVATTRAWSPRILSQPTGPVARSRGSR